MRAAGFACKQNHTHVSIKSVLRCNEGRMPMTPPRAAEQVAQARAVEEWAELFSFVVTAVGVLFVIGSAIYFLWTLGR